MKFKNVKLRGSWDTKLNVRGKNPSGVEAHFMMLLFYVLSRSIHSKRIFQQTVSKAIHNAVFALFLNLSVHALTSQAHHPYHTTYNRFITLSYQLYIVAMILIIWF